MSQPQPRPPLAWTLHGVGVLVLAAWAAEAFFSQSPRHAGLSVLWIVQGIGWAALAWAAWIPMDFPGVRRIFMGWAVAFRIAASFTHPVMENDYARHLWDGWRLLSSGNPYDRAPVSFYRDASVPEDLQEVLTEVNSPDIPTIYGPVLQGWSALAAAVHAGHLWPFKALLITADLLVLLILAREPGSRAALLYGWCPLVIHETAANAHAEVLAVLPFLLAWRDARAGREVRGAAWMGLAVATKLTALVAIPFLLAGRNPRAWGALILAVALPYLPFWLQGSFADWPGLQRFLNEWEFNSSLVGLLEWVSTPAAARAVAGGVGVTALAFLWWRWRGVPIGSKRLDWVFGIQITASAVANPWYLLWIAPFAAITPSLTAWVALGVVSLSYATALNLGLPGTEPFTHPAWVRPIEYGVILMALGMDLIHHRISRGTHSGIRPLGESGSGPALQPD